MVAPLLVFLIQLAHNSEKIDAWIMQIVDIYISVVKVVRFQSVADEI